MYYFSKKFFKEWIKEKIYVENFVEEIWKKCDEFLIEIIVKKVANCKNLDLSKQIIIIKFFILL